MSLKQFFIKLILVIGIVVIAALVLKKTFDLGYVQGYNKAIVSAQTEIDNIVAMVKSGAISYKKITPISPSPAPQAQVTQPQQITWGGPALWAAVNKRRVQLGVNGLSEKDELCTLASIRLNQLLELGKLDGHEGFSRMPTDRPDLKWIYEKYNLSEFLLSGARTADEAVTMWENTLGHKKLLTGGEYVWGCYAQDSFAVAIAAY